jgi:hypothetical protein
MAAYQWIASHGLLPTCMIWTLLAGCQQDCCGCSSPACHGHIATTAGCDRYQLQVSDYPMPRHKLGHPLQCPAWPHGVQGRRLRADACHKLAERGSDHTTLKPVNPLMSHCCLHVHLEAQQAQGERRSLSDKHAWHSPSNQHGLTVAVDEKLWFNHNHGKDTSNKNRTHTRAHEPESNRLRSC